MPDPVLYTLAADTLEALQDAAATAGITLPTRQYVHAGEVAFDCAEVVVAIGRMFHGLPDAERITSERSAQKSVELHAWIVRDCQPGLEDGSGDPVPPTPTDLDSAAKAVAGDLHLLVNGLRAAYASKDIYSTCQAVAWAEARVVGPSGRFTGVVFDIRVQVPS